MQFEALGHLAASAVEAHLLAHPNSHAYSRPATWSRDAWDQAIAGKSTVDAQLGTAQASIPQVHALVMYLVATVCTTFLERIGLVLSSHLREMGVWIGSDPHVRGGHWVVPIHWDIEQ